jgi:hypothetical protein
MKTRMKRVFPIFLAVAALTLTVSGCGGKAKERLLTVDDLAGVVGPAPDTPAGASYDSNGAATELGITDLRDRATTASDRATIAMLETADLRRIYQRSFSGAINVADGTAYLFGNAAGAGDAFAGLRTSLARETQPGQKLAEVAVKGLGDESWGAHLSGGSEAALFLFRTSNLVVVTDMSCDASCGLDIVAAARTYAEGIATRASQPGG